MEVPANLSRNGLDSNNAAITDFVRVWLISSVLPDDMKLGGELILHRSLQNPFVHWEVMPSIPASGGLPYRILNRLSRTRIYALASYIGRFFPDPLDWSEAERMSREFQPDVIVTVAHGWDYLLADKVARRLRLPLVILAHDWWPAKDEVPAGIRARVERRFKRICRGCAAVICVCEGMRAELGGLPHAFVSYPQPSAAERDPEFATGSGIRRILYSGNLYEYGPMVEGALDACGSSDVVRLETYGPKPMWAAGSEERFREAGLYHGLVSPSGLVGIARSYDWMLATMSFDPLIKQRMRTSFPSKIVEMAQLGKPLVIWGPEWCSAVIWARERNSALCVTDPSPQALIEALEELAGSESEQLRLAAAARHAADHEFNPAVIHDQFISILRKACGKA